MTSSGGAAEAFRGAPRPDHTPSPPPRDPPRPRTPMRKTSTAPDRTGALVSARAGLALAFAVVLGACARTPAPVYRVGFQGVVPVARDAADAFVPLVAASTAEARCEDLRNPPPQMGVRVLSLVFGAPTERRINVSLDADGAAVRYSDVRGDLSAPAGGGIVTTLSIDLVRRTAVAMNRTGGSEPRGMMIPFDDAMASPNLDHPARWLERVLAFCGGTPHPAAEEG